MTASKTNQVLFLIALAIPGLLGATPSMAGNLETCLPGASPPAASEAITIKAVGDIVLGNNWPHGGWPPGYERDTERRLKRVLGDADVIFGNFEGALTTHNVSPKKPREGAVFAFRMPPRFASLLRNAGFNALAIANNHTFDFGLTGYQDTVAHLSQAGILLVGEPNRIAVQQLGDVTLAWIGFSYLQHHNHIGDHERLAALIDEARALADLVVVSIQAGAEGSEALRVRDQDETFLGENRGNVLAFARRAVDLGADLVIGHGPHVLRGVECYQGKLIAYSLGNFAGYGSFSIKRAAAISAVLEVRLAKSRETIGFDILPVRFDEHKLPEIDPDKLAHYLINDLSSRPPLNNNVQFTVGHDGEATYQRWLGNADLVQIVNE